MSSTEKITGRWSKSDTEKLIEMYKGNVPIETICQTLKRNKISVLNKVAHTHGLHRTMKSAT